ncbi:MAG: helix-turn-helix transcriptional regulator [Faecalimonas umbilicata]|uniref:helix-turn-helix domain-containing protein n=1 Tax=Faecalimonas umbilicata TaxID=1912855 RepID=UPI001E15EF73|nr:helix-turn-helix transcriptional regulator [Faecalimonas umbilicata]MBS5763786.1 helix-turn-helix transcriptional regulator [Lachnospiraceae bacterium]MCI5987149.1 helix-turn-helix domain-containing protein [Faecalimonas umbilicata]MDY5093463.1 helix-turn-helix transcriptional regulator [Faecalimonas umbilicata]
MEYDMKILIHNIDLLIRDNGITQNDLASICGTYQSRVSECMAGKKDFTLRQLIAIADYFHVSLDSLLERDTSNIQINSLSDVCNLLFTLYESANAYITEEYIPEMEGCDSNGNYTEIPAHSGAPALCFDNSNIISFLLEWKEALSVLSLNRGNELYSTWKRGILEKLKNNLSIYDFSTKRDYQEKLCKRISSPDRYPKKADIDKSNLSEIDKKLLLDFLNQLDPELPFF